MKIKVKYEEQEYFLGFTRATAIEMGKHVKKSKNNDGSIDNTEILIKCSLKAYQPKLSTTEADTITKFIMDNYNLVGKLDDEGNVVEKGLIQHLNDNLMGCMPKGFIGQATMQFEIVE